MAFDAGAVESRLTIDPSQFDRTLDAAEARVKKFESEKHQVKVSAVLDSASLSRARQQFAQLDNQISKDAMSRLRSNPQGSVLGALNALFSPHPVTGAPSASQAAQQGLLGKIIQAPGGGGVAGPTPSNAGGTVVQQVLGDQAAGTAQGNANQRVSTVGLPNTTTTTDNVNVVGAPTNNSITTTDRVNAVGLPTDNTINTTDRVSTVGLPTDNAISTTDTVTQRVIPARDPATGRFVGQDTTSTNTVREKIDEASLKEQADKAGADAADTTNDSMAKESRRKGSGWFSGFLSGIPAMIASAFSGSNAPGTATGSGGGGNAKGTSLLTLLGGGGNGESGGGDQSVLDKGLLGAIGPGILGTSFKTASLVGLGGAALGGIPALAAGLAPLGLAGAGAGILTAGASSLIGSKNTKSDPNAQGPLYQQAQTAGKALQAMVQTAAAGLTVPLKNLFNQIPALAKSVTPALSQIFSSTASLIQPVVTGLVSALKEIAPGLSAAFKATGPLLEPLIKGIGSLVGGLLPGLVSLLHAAAPAVSVVAGFFGSLGANLGTMFKQFSTVIGPSSAILKALLDVVTGLLPIIGGLAQVMAATLGPAFVAFAGTIKALEPFLVGIGKIFAQFAGAVLTDLSAGLQLVANVLKAVAPAFNVLATSLGSVFTTLESKGGFAQLGNVLEGIATPLGNLITSLVRGLAPAIPPILTLFSQLVNVVSTVGVQVLTALIPPITNLVTIALGALLKVLPTVIPIVSQFLTTFTTDAGAIITQVGGALLNLATVVLTKLLQAAQPLIPVVLQLLNAFTPLLNILTPVVAGTISAIADALAAVVNAVPAGAVTALAVGIGSVVGAMKLWGAVTGTVASVVESTLASSVGGAIGTLKEFALATEGVTLAEKAQLGAMLALDAVNPLAWAVLAGAAVAGLVIGLNDLARGSHSLVDQLTAQDNATGFNISGYQKLAAQLTTVSGSFTAMAQAGSNAVKGQGGQLGQVAQQYSATAAATLALATSMQARLTTLSGTFGVSQVQIEKWAAAAGVSAAKFGGAGENVGLLTGQIVAFVNKNAQAITATSSLGTNVAIFGNDVFSANTQLDAFNQIFNTLVGNLLTKQQAVTQGQQSFDNLKQSIASSGAASTQSAQSFQAYIGQIQSSLDALQKGGASVSTLNDYLQTQIGHLESLGPLNKGEQQDLDNLRAFQDTLANSTNGLNAQQKTMITQFETGLIPDLQKIGADTPTVTGAISNLANSIIQTGNNSASTKNDRAQLIDDLGQVGIHGKAATDLVNGLQKQIDALKGKVVSVGVIGSGSGTITFAEQGIKNAATGLLEFHAMGGPIGGHGGPTQDNIPVWASTGEFMMQAAAVNKYGLPFMEAVNAQRLAAGGPIDISSILSAPDWMGNVMASAAKSAEGTDAALMIADMKAKIAAAAAAAAAAAKLTAGTFVSSGGASGGIIQAMFASMAAARGWTGAELTALLEVESREAGFNMTAQNPTSNAYGLAQFINGASEYAQYGGNSTTASGQITAMLNYISQRYGDPIAAWQHELDFGWYGDGGMISEPVVGRGLNSGRGYVLGERGSEMVTPIGGARGGKSVDDLADRLDQLHADMREMVAATRQVPAGVGHHVGSAIGGATHDASFRSRYPRNS